MHTKQSGGLSETDENAVAEGLFRSEEHTSELQSLTNLVCRLLLEKKKNNLELKYTTNLLCFELNLAKNKNNTTIIHVKNTVYILFNDLYSVETIVIISDYALMTIL